LIGLAVSVVVTGTALAGGGPALSTYGGPADVQTQLAHGASPVASVKATGGTLPFTGLDLGIAIAIAVGLVALGIASRRWGKRTTA
jgi:hypothetical protein